MSGWLFLDISFNVSTHRGQKTRHSCWKKHWCKIIPSKYRLIPYWSLWGEKNNLLSLVDVVVRVSHNRSVLFAEQCLWSSQMFSNLPKDTSAAPWQSLNPWIDNVTSAQPHRFMCCCVFIHGTKLTQAVGFVGPCLKIFNWLSLDQRMPIFSGFTNIINFFTLQRDVIQSNVFMRSW